MPYVKQPISFTVTEWPLSPGSQNFIFSHTRQFQDVGRLLLYIAYELKQAHVFHTYVPFTILNIWSGISNVSFGYTDKPSSRLFTIPPLVVTFALTKDKVLVHPRQQRRPTPRSVIYGRDHRNANQFLSIRIPQEILDQCHITNLGIPNLRYLYNVIGMFTKNLVRHNDWFYGNLRDTFDQVKPDLGLYSQLSMPISTLVKTHSFPYWAYCPTVWTLASNLITDLHISDQLLLYYLQFLYLVEPAYGPITTIFGQDNRLHKFVHKGLLDICDYWDSEKPIHDISSIACGMLIARQLDFPISDSNLDLTVNSFLSSVRQNFTYKQDKTLLINIRANAYRISLNLIQNIKHDWSGLL